MKIDDMQVQKQIDQLLTLRASEWLELLPHATEAQLRAFASWLSESRLHVQEFLEIAEVELCLNHLDAQRLQDVDSLLKRMAPNVAALPMRPVAGPFPQPQNKRRWKVGNFAAAACMLVALGAVLLGYVWNDSRQYTTSVGEQRVFELPDASVVALNADSQIEVDIEETVRQIDLTRGEAIFKVSHDPRRPFRVRTRAGVVQAVGTQFNVHDRANGDTRVSVLEGKVRAASGSGAEILLSAGDEADIRLDGSISRRENAIVANTVAWRQQRLIFENATIEEMAAEFNRYNQSVRLRVEGLAGHTHRFDGTFDATNPRALAEVLAREPELVVETRDGEIVIRKR